MITQYHDSAASKPLLKHCLVTFICIFDYFYGFQRSYFGPILFANARSFKVKRNLDYVVIQL